MVMPLNVLENSMNRKLSLLLKDGRQLEGKLAGFDEYMNMVLEDTEETIRIPGKRTEENEDEPEVKVRRLGMVILRGNNVVTITPV